MNPICATRTLVPEKPTLVASALGASTGGGGLYGHSPQRPVQYDGYPADTAVRQQDLDLAVICRRTIGLRLMRDELHRPDYRQVPPSQRLTSADRAKACL
jgi:hypothetical protein